MKDKKNMPKKFTQEEFFEKMKILQPELEIRGEYHNTSSHFLCKHINCGYEWETSAASLLRTHNGCPKCKHAIRMTQEEFEEKMLNINPNITIIGKYLGLSKRIQVQCNKDGYIWNPEGSNLISGHGCPMCSGRIVNSGINDIYTQRPDLLKYFTNPDDAKMYSIGSHTQLEFICPNCKTKKTMEIKTLVSQGLSCNVCSDGISYPNKFARAMLKQLPIEDFITEYSPDWSNGKYYDNYFKYKNQSYILEMDGGFHFKDNNMNGISLKEVQINDQLKDELASMHNIKIIRINSVKSEMKYLKNNMYNSYLNDLFNLDAVDWNLCNEIALESSVKTNCEYYESNKKHMTLSEIASNLNISIQTLIKHRKLGVELGWCTYDKEEQKKISYSLISSPKSISVKVYDLLGNFIGLYKSLNNCAKQLSENFNLKFSGSSIKKAIDNKNGIYKDFRFELVEP